MENGRHKVNNDNSLGGWNVRRRNLGRDGPEVASNTNNIWW